MHIDLLAAHGSFSQLHKQRLNAGFNERGRAQFQQERAHLGQRAARQLAQLFEAEQRVFLVLLKLGRQHICEQAGGPERLADLIMQVTRQALAFFDGGQLLRLCIGASGLNRACGLVSKNLQAFGVRHIQEAHGGAVQVDEPDYLLLNSDRHAKIRVHPLGIRPFAPGRIVFDVRNDERCAGQFHQLKTWQAAHREGEAAGRIRRVWTNPARCRTD